VFSCGISAVSCSVYEVETVKHFSPALAGLDLKSEFFDSLKDLTA
jgi:hypothetical protein